MTKSLQQCVCLSGQNRHCLVYFWKSQKAVSIFPHEAKAQLEVFCIQPIVFGKGKIAPVLILPHEAK